MAKTKFKVGDRVKISWAGDKSNGKIGTIVKKCNDTCWTIKIPGFAGHDGGIKDGTRDKWWANEFSLTKLPTEKKSMKIEVKQTKKTEKPNEIVYPCFKKSNTGNDLIVLFFSEECGIAVKVSKSSKYFPGFIPKRRWIPSTFFETPLENYSATISSIP
jgi:hypothetical protein